MVASWSSSTLHLYLDPGLAPSDSYRSYVYKAMTREFVGVLRALQRVGAGSPQGALSKNSHRKTDGCFESSIER